MGRFPFDVKFQFELPENSMNVGKGQLFPEFPEKMTLRSIPNSFLGKFSPGISVPFDFPSQNFPIFRRMVGFQQFPDFLETFPGKFRDIYRC